MVQIPGPGLKVGENPRGLPGGGCWCVELTDALGLFATLRKTALFRVCNSLTGLKLSASCGGRLN